MARPAPARRSGRPTGPAGGPFGGGLRGGFGGGFGPIALRPGRGALALVGAMTVLTALSTWVPRTLDWLLVHHDTLSGLRLTGLLTNGLVTPPGSFFGVLLLAALTGFLFQDRLRAWWRADRVRLVAGAVGALLALWALERWVLPERGFGLVAGGLMVLWFGTAVERTWGARRLLWFAAVIMVATNTFGALLVWLWPAGLRAAIGDGVLPLFGEGPLVHALLTVWCLMAGDRRLAFLGVEARKLVWVFVALDAIDLLFAGRIAGSMGLFAIGLTWALVNGHLRPRLLLDRLRLWRIERRLSKRRRGLKVIDGGRRLHRWPAMEGRWR